MRETYSKKKTYYIVSKIYDFIRENPGHIVLEKYKNLEGMYEPEDDIISLDPRKSIVPTLIHEILHYWHDDWSEKKVLKEESKIVRSLSLQQMKNIIKMLAAAL